MGEASETVSCIRDNHCVNTRWRNTFACQPRPSRRLTTLKHTRPEHLGDCPRPQCGLSYFRKLERSTQVVCLPVVSMHRPPNIG
jgi:hypothetical protein